MKNIPIYRAKKKNDDEYIEGHYKYVKGARGYENHSICYNKQLGRGFANCDISIDPTTLAIYFPFFFIKDLFFGLDNGKGASIVEAKFKSDNSSFKGVAICDSNGHVFYDKNDDWVSIDKLTDIEIVGINS